MSRLMVLALIILFAVCGVKSAVAWEAFFLYTISGDTIRVFPKESDKEVNVRLYGLDISNWECKGEDAVRLAYQRFVRPGDVVNVIPIRTCLREKNGLIGYVEGLVTFGDTLLNAALVRYSGSGTSAISASTSNEASCGTDIGAIRR